MLVKCCNLKSPVFNKRSLLSVLFNIVYEDFINLFIIKIYSFIFISLIFNNYVMENFGRFHDVLEHFKIEKNHVGPHTNANGA